METVRYWIWLSQLNISPKARAAVVRDFGDAETAFRSEEGSFRGRTGISAREAEALELRDLSETDRVLARCREQNLTILPITDPAYPACLRQIFDPPAVLYVQGTLPPVDEVPVLAVIGTRRASPYGIKMSRDLAAQLANAGAVVLSLLTQGADEAAAQGALSSACPCIGVLGTSHEVCRLPIAREVARTGAVISEYPPGRESMKHFFRERNRIAAGLSDGVVVVEAPEKSGTRLFVMDAVEQGKDIFAVPGNADSENAAGTLSLIKEGAKLVTDAEDVLEEYRVRYPAFFSEDEPAAVKKPAGKHHRTPPPNISAPAGSDPRIAPPNISASVGSDPRIAPPAKPPLTDDQQRILDAIGEFSTHVDDITERTGLPTARVLSQLTLLEIKGLIRRESGKRFSKNCR
ncbi:MAG: DNA-protecting protein DprA [Oscillospiraceae bacterium]|nr:DNA-protecting protein DprA [Oscillospiraceae bacterium]